MHKYSFILVLLLFLIFLIRIFSKQYEIPSVLSSFTYSRNIFYNLNTIFRKEDHVKEFEKLKKYMETKKGSFGLYIRDMSTDTEFVLNENKEYYAASVYKIPVAVATLKSVQEGKIKLTDKQKYLPQDFTTGTGYIYNFDRGKELSYDELLDYLLKYSDNVAQNILLRTIDRKTIEESFSITNTKNRYYSENISSAKNIGELLNIILDHKYLDKEYAQLLLTKMTDTQFEDRISLGLDKDIVFAHKIGNWGDTSSWHDCGVASKNGKNVVVCFMSEGTTFVNVVDISKNIGAFINELF